MFLIQFEIFKAIDYSLPTISSKFTRLPVRAYFNGVTQLNNGTYQNFTEVHDFYDFRPDHVFEEFFQVLF
jgi:hypothetical protein